MAATSGGAGTDAATTSDGTAQSAAPSFSSTNVVEDGVDEPDVVKTDGRHLVTISEQTLRVVDLTGPQPVEVGALDLGPSAWGSQLLVAGDRALVLSSSAELVWRDGGPAVPEVDPSGYAEIRPTDVPIAAALLREVDLSDPAAPRVIATVRVEGGLVDARLIGTTARVVLQSSPSKLQFVSPSSPSAQQRALDANREVIETSTAEDWLPSFVAQDAAGATTASGPLVACDRVHHPADFAGFSTSSVLTVDLAQGLDRTDAVAVLADAQQVYASHDALYVAVNRYRHGPVRRRDRRRRPNRPPRPPSTSSPSPAARPPPTRRPARSGATCSTPSPCRSATASCAWRPPTGRPGACRCRQSRVRNPPGHPATGHPATRHRATSR